MWDGRPSVGATRRGDPLGRPLRSPFAPVVWAPARGAPTLFRLDHFLRRTVRRCLQLVIQHTHRVQQRFVNRDRVVPFRVRCLLVVNHPTRFVEDTQRSSSCFR